MKNYFLSYMLCCCTLCSFAQHVEEKPDALDLLQGLEYRVEAQGSFASGKTPLWLNANKHGLSSLEETNGYLRASAIRPMSTDTLRRWGVGYGLDVAVPFHYTSDVVVQQAFAEVKWLHGALTVGSKEYPMEMKNQTLSSGGQTLGINARPVPQVRIAFHDYAPVPLTKGWVHLKGHLAFGMMTDENWQHDFTQKRHDYTDNLLYHSKAGFIKIGKEDCYYPLSVEMGLEMATIFGGTSYQLDADGTMREIRSKRGFLSFWHAFKPDGGEVEESLYTNAEGDLLGSWMARVNYDADTWRLSLYADKFFEDHSSMFQLDFDGKGEGEEWQVSKKRRYLLYDFKDMLLGAELTFKYSSKIRHLLFEYIYTKYQSGPIYHDHTPNLSDHIGGNDNYYNHYIFSGWQHWGQVMGNPLYRSPLYNDDGTLKIQDNRFRAMHFGMDGMLRDVDYRLLATFQDGVGTYELPYTKKRTNVSVLAECAYQIPHGILNGWQIKGGYGMDLGSLLGHNYGAQLTITKRGLFKNKK